MTPPASKSSRPKRAIDQLLDMCRGEFGDEFVQVIQNAHYLPRILFMVNDRRRRNVRSPLDLEPVASSIPHVRFDAEIMRNKTGRKLVFKDAGGAFRVNLGGSQSVFLIRQHLPGKAKIEYVAGPEKSVRALHMLLEAGAKTAKLSLPRKGTWVTFTWDISTAFKRWRLHDDVVRFKTHPAYSDLEQDANQFFGRIDLWTRHNQPGFRKVLLVGPPGTGKTSMAMAMAREWEGKAVVVLSDDKHFMNVCKQAAAKRIPCIVITEELDTLVRVNAETLNFLDGVSTPRNPAGTYLIATTNYPKRIDPRILQRPGRIHRIIRVGALRSKAAADVARMYLPDDIVLPVKELGKALDRTTPAEIAEIVATAIRLIAGEERPFDIQLLIEARQQLKASLAKVDYRNKGTGAMSFGEDDDPTAREDTFERLGGLDDGFEDEDLSDDPAAATRPAGPNPWGRAAATDETEVI